MAKTKKTLSPQRRSHSTIDKLPVNLKAAVDAMLVDNVVPEDYHWPIAGKPTYEEICEYCKFKGYTISESAMGRYGKRMRAISRLKEAGLIAREAMSGLTDENASETQKAAVELITAHTIELLADSTDMTPNELQKTASAMKDCAAVAITADKYIRTQLEEKAKLIAASTKEKLEKVGVDRKVIQSIIDEQLGITSKK